MTKIETFYRKADVPASEAISQILKRFSKAELVAFETKEATPSEARTAKVQPGAQVFAATLKVSEAPPVPEESESEGAPPEPEFGGVDDAPAEGPKETESEPKEEKSEGDSEEKDSKPPKEKSEGEGDTEGLGEKMKPEEEMVHLLKQILDAVGGGAGALGAPKPPMGAGGPPHHGPPAGPPGAGAPPVPGGGLDTPDIGAPGPPQHGGPPLPPPVDKPGGLAFSHYDPSVASFAVIRRDANELGLRGLRVEAEATYPTHRVAHMTTAGEATVNGLKVDIAGNNIAVLTLTKR